MGGKYSCFRSRKCATAVVRTLNFFFCPVEVHPGFYFSLFRRNCTDLPAPTGNSPAVICVGSARVAWTHAQRPPLFAQACSTHLHRLVEWFSGLPASQQGIFPYFQFITAQDPSKLSLFVSGNDRMRQPDSLMNHLSHGSALSCSPPCSISRLRALCAIALALTTLLHAPCVLSGYYRHRALFGHVSRLMSFSNLTLAHSSDLHAHPRFRQTYVTTARQAASTSWEHNLQSLRLVASLRKFVLNLVRHSTALARSTHPTPQFSVAHDGSVAGDAHSRRGAAE